MSVKLGSRSLGIIFYCVFLTCARADDNPSLELLEFIGQWETPDGELVDPFQLADVEVASKDLPEVENEDSQDEK